MSLSEILNDPFYSMIILALGSALFILALDWVGDRTWKKPRTPPNNHDRPHPAE